MGNKSENKKYKGKPGARNSKKISCRKRAANAFGDHVKKFEARKEINKIPEANTTKILKYLKLKDYEKCLKKIKNFLNANNDKTKRSQVLLIQAVCWTFLDMKENEALST